MFCLLLIFVALAAAKPTSYNSRPYNGVLQTRQVYDAVSNGTGSPEVDLGYDVYRGYTNASTNIDVYKGYVKNNLLATSS